MSPFLDLYEPLDVIGNGSFGIIRKVRRKSDGLIFARKELNFERMTERDRKQIVAEVNILKDLHHEHIVRYHDRYVDRDAGILYILMEYCGGGDLSTIIKQASKQNRPISEDTIWNYFMQILLALHHCHHPNGHGRSASGSGQGLMEGEGGSSRRPQILHRDLKPDNVFLDDNNNVKLGDFGLSKALAQTNFANTYVGTPYYMSPELMQEKAYDSKSDIWSLGCLIYELCALKPPFHEAKTHSELSILIRNGRIPPLPRGYSQSLFGVIKAMLSLNPAMRPSAAQLLQHERLELVFKVSETEKMLATVKAHKNTMVARERDLLAREQALNERDHHISSILDQKEADIANLQRLVVQLQQDHQSARFTQHELDVAIKHAISHREDELRVLVMKREEEVAVAMAKREDEIMEAVRKREGEVCEAWSKREAEIRQEVEASIQAVEERVRWIAKKEAELNEEEARLDALNEELEQKIQKHEEQRGKGRTAKAPLEEVKNIMEPISLRKTHATPSNARRTRADSYPTPKVFHSFPTLETPITRPSYTDLLPSAMKGVVLTSTGEALATPAPAELDTLFNSSPKVGLNFAKIFDFDDSIDGEAGPDSSDDECTNPLPSPTIRKERERREKEKSEIAGEDDTTETFPKATPTVSSSTSSLAVAPPTRLRRPSIRRTASSSSVPSHHRASSIPASSSDSSSSSCSSSSSATQAMPAKPLPHPHLSSTQATGRPGSGQLPQYDLGDEENLPSPFLKRVERMSITTLNSASSSSTAAASSASSSAGLVRVSKKRPSTGNLLRAVAAANNVGRKAQAPGLPTPAPSNAPVDSNTPNSSTTRPSLLSARKASEDARKALSRP